MKKDIEWAKRQVADREFNSDGGELHLDVIRTAHVYKILNQLDEPEVLSQEITEENGMSESEWAEVIDRYKWHLEQEGYVVIEKPTIPQFVADYLNIAKRDITLMRALEIANRRSELPKWEKEYDWISENDETFARAWLDGYTVEEEPLYTARLTLIKEDKGYLNARQDNPETKMKDLELGIRFTHPDYRHLSEFTKEELEEIGVWDHPEWIIEEEK